MTDHPRHAKLMRCERTPRFLPGLPREWKAIDPALIAVLRDLANGKRRWPLLLHGRPGVGKTCASLAMADRVWSTAYFTVEGLADIVMGRGQLDAGAVWERIAAEELVVLDELACRENTGDLEYSIVKRVLDIKETCGRPGLICLSNVGPGLLRDVYDGRIHSRITAGTQYELGGVDRRAAR